MATPSCSLSQQQPHEQPEHRKQESSRQHRNSGSARKDTPVVSPIEVSMSANPAPANNSFHA